jgi:hypothetical protein
LLPEAEFLSPFLSKAVFYVDYLCMWVSSKQHLLGNSLKMAKEFIKWVRKDGCIRTVRRGTS